MNSLFSAARGLWGRSVWLLIVIVSTGSIGGTGHAEVLYSRQGALKLAFPGAERIERQYIFLTEKQSKMVRALCQCELTSKLFTAYVGYKHGRRLGHAFIDTHVVRTLPETFMVVIDDKGAVIGVHILAFNEPREYLPPHGWLAQFRGHVGVGRLGAGHEIAGLAGATLSAHAVTCATRKLLAIYQVAGLGEKATDAAPTAHARAK